MKRFIGKKAIVTGATSGIGRAVASRLAEEGASVAFSFYSRPDAAKALAEEIAAKGGSAFAFALDLGDTVTLEEKLAGAIKGLGGLDILINNGGEWMKKRPIIDCDNALWDRLLAVNLTSVFYLCRKAAGVMIAQGSGCIVNVTSIVARTGGGGGSVPYCAAKAGVNTFTRGLAQEMAGKGIRVNGVAPGLVDTPMLDTNFNAENKNGLAQSVPLKRMAQPAELAEPILFLASDAASYITGEILEVNGGALMD